MSSLAQKLAENIFVASEVQIELLTELGISDDLSLVIARQLFQLKSREDATKLVKLCRISSVKESLSKLVENSLVSFHEDDSPAELECALEVVALVDDLPLSNAIVQPFLNLLLCSARSVRSKAAIALSNFFSFHHVEPQKVWPVYRQCMDDKDLQIGAFIVWLKYIPYIVNDAFFQSLLSTEEYWEILRSSIVDISYDKKKYSLQILTRSVTAIKENIDIHSFKWNTLESKRYTDDWKRYVTLMEIISVDTSVNQTKASIADIAFMISPKSKVPYTWGLTLLVAGLFSTMETIRKVINEVVICLPAESMQIFVENPEYLLKNVIEPYSMQAPLFSTTQSWKIRPSTLKCAYGTKLARFIRRLVSHSKDVSILKALFESLWRQRQSYDPARIYILSGIIKGFPTGIEVTVEDCSLLLNYLAIDRLAESPMREEIMRYQVLTVLLMAANSSNQVEKLRDHLKTFTARVLPRTLPDELRELSKEKTTDPVEVSLKLDEDVATSIANISTYFTKTRNVEEQAAILKQLTQLCPQLSEYPDDLRQITQDIWDYLTSDRLMANARIVHHAFLEFAFHDCQPFHSEIANDVINQSKARRSLLPVLAKLLYNRPTDHAQVSLFYIRAFVKEQIDTHLWRMEHSIAAFADSEYPQLEPVYLNSYGIEEKATKVYALGWFASIQDTSVADFCTDYILRNDEFHLFKILNNQDSFEERVRVSCYQILLLLEPKVSRSKSIQLMKGDLLSALVSEPCPSVRIYMEWLVTRIALHYNEIDWITQLITDLKDITPKKISSLEKIAFLVGQQISDVDFHETFITKLLSLSTSNKAPIRHIGVNLLTALDTLGFPSSTPALKKLREIVQLVAQDPIHKEILSRYRHGIDTIWDVNKDFTLVGIANGVVGKASDCSTSVLLEKDFKRYLPNEGSLSLPIGKDMVQEDNEPEIEEPQLSEVDDASVALQTKSGAWNATENAREQGVKRGELIVIASLVDKPPNLGGICRLCDVLGVELLCLGDLAVTQHAQFKNVAVTSDRWMPMKQVGPSEIAPYMRHMKKEGYTLVGLEQTDNSVQLTSSLEFPKKMVLLLGMEREGIPRDLLAELDYCIEIKQYGIVRSMNIQTATAVLCHAYSMKNM